MERMLQLLDGRVYWDRDPKNCASNAFPGHQWLIQRMNMPLGWWEDYVFFMRNFHPLFSICFAHAQHPILLRDRLMLELAVQAYCFAMMEYTLIGEEDARRSSSVIWWYMEMTCYVTIPSILLWWSLYGCLACPCLQRENACVFCSQKNKRNLGLLGQSFYPLCLAASAVLIYTGITIALTRSIEVSGYTQLALLAKWGLGVVQGWLLFALWHALATMNYSGHCVLFCCFF
jgi:hypothetical protein